MSLVCEGIAYITSALEKSDFKKALQCGKGFSIRDQNVFYLTNLTIVSNKIIPMKSFFKKKKKYS